MLHVVALCAVFVVAFFLGWKCHKKTLRNSDFTWYVRPHTEKTLEEFGLSDDVEDAAVIVQADYIRVNAPGSNSRMS